jgi:hypothetical protein
VSATKWSSGDVVVWSYEQKGLALCGSRSAATATAGVERLKRLTEAIRLAA